MERRSGGQTGSVPLRLGRSAEARGEAIWEEQEGVCHTHSGPGSLLSSQAGPLTSKAPHTPGRTGPGDIGAGPGRSGVAVGRGPPRLEEQERRGARLPCPFKSRKPAGLPGEVPCPLRPGVGGTPGPRLFLEPKPQSHNPQGRFQPCGS